MKWFFIKNSNWKNLQVIVITFIGFILISLLPISIITQAESENTDSNNLSNIPEKIKPAYQPKKEDTISPKYENDNRSLLINKQQTHDKYINNSNLNNPRLSVIPTYNGTSVSSQIKANESFILENSINNINITNSYDNDNNFQNNSNIEFLSGGYSNKSQVFSIENITSSHNYVNVEYETSLNSEYVDTSEGSTYQSFASSFIVNETLNLTEIRLWYGGLQGADLLTGEAYITGISNGNPNSTKIGNEIISLPLIAGPNTTLQFSKPITLTPGLYAIVVNETSAEVGESFFRFRISDDVTGDGVNESQMWYKIWGDPSWSSTVNWDLIFSYNYIPLNPNNFSQIRQYLSPQEIELKYNNTDITSFSNNNLLLDGNIIEFTSNSSITFDLSYNINYKSSINPITLSTLFSVNNATQPFWNNSFANNAIPLGSYSINQRNLTIYNLAGDWENTLVERNGSDYSSLTYSNGSDQLILHLNETTEAFSWLLQFTSPNYLSDLLIKQNNIAINVPYQVNTSDTITFIANLSTSTYNGNNASIFVYDFNSVLNYTEININVINGDIVFTDWVISNSLSTSNHVNGSYQIIIKWLSENGTQVGYFGTDIEIITQTTLISPNSIPNTIISQNISISTDFQSDQSTTTIDNANLTYSTSWGEADFLFQSLPGTNYTANINTSTASEGIGTITIQASQLGYVNRSIVYNVILIRNTSISVVPNGTSVYYNDVINISIIYQNDLLTNISGAVVLVESYNAIEQPDNSYVYDFNTSNIDASFSTFQVVIFTNKSYHINRTETLIFFLLTNPTNIIGDVNYPNLTSVMKNFSSGTEDAFQFILRYDDTRHDNSIENATLTHNGSFIASISGTGVDQDNSTGYWTLNINPSKANITQTIMFTFTKDGYDPAYYYIILDISESFFTFSYQINAQQVVPFGSFYTLRINVTDSYHSSFIPDVTITADPILNVNSLGNGSYDIIYTGATKNVNGNFSYLVQFSKTGFITNDILLNYTITPPLSTFETEVTLNNGSVIDSEWGDATYLNITFVDSIHNISLQPLSIPLTNVSNQEILVEYVSSENGFLIYKITPLTVGSWSLNLTLEPVFSTYFYPNYTILTISASARNTATTFTFVNSTNGNIDVYYDRFVEIGVQWYDSELNIYAEGSFTPGQIWIDGQSRKWIEYIRYDGNIHIFHIYGATLESYSTQIDFYSNLFNLSSTTIQINVELLQTDEISVIKKNGFLNETTSKFGYTAELDFIWSISDNQSIIHNPNLEILYNDVVLSGESYTKYGIVIVTNYTELTTKIFFNFYSSSDITNGYQIGSHKFEFRFDSYGLEPQSYVWDVYTEGYDLAVELTYDEGFTSGSIYTITIQINYSNNTLIMINSNPATPLRYQTIPDGSLLGSPVQNVPIDFIIEVLFENGSIGFYQDAITTNAEGEATFVLSSQMTSNILEFRNISITIAGASNNQLLRFSLSPEDLPFVQEPPGSLSIELIAIIVILTSIFITTVLFSYNRRRTRKNQKIIATRKKTEETQERIALISNIYTILIATSSGLPVFSILNSLYKDNPTISEIVSGLSVGIDTFLQSFQEDFMEQLGEHIPGEQQVSISNINRQTFQILILGTVSFRVFVFMKEKPPQFTNDIFKDIISELESKIQLEKLFDVTLVKPKIEHIIRQRFPLTLLSTFVIDPGRLIFLENEIKRGKGPNISLNALLAIKQLALIRSGNIRNLKLSLQEQSKEFNRLHKNEELGEIGIMHYEVAYNMLANTLKLPLELVLETLWKASSPEVLILIPFSEEVLPISSGGQNN